MTATIVLLFLAFASCQAGFRDNVPADQLSMLLKRQNYVAVPMTRGKEQFTVPCRVGDEKFRMLVDTGADRSFIDEKLSQRLGLKPGTERQWQMLGAVMTGRDVAVRGLQIGGFDTRLIGGVATFIACDMSSLNDRLREQGEPPIAGILGTQRIHLRFRSNRLPVQHPLPTHAGRWVTAESRRRVGRDPPRGGRQGRPNRLEDAYANRLQKPRAHFHRCRPATSVRLSRRPG